MKPEIKIFKNADEISEEIANILMELIANSNGNNIHIALSGGSTPIAAFKYLTEKYGSKLNYKQFHFWWGDDRCVAPTDDESNYKWANELWLKPIGIATENIHRVHGENNPTDEAIRYSEEIKKKVPFKNGWPVFDLMLLGIGEDGHTASIFPHQMELLNSNKICDLATHPNSGQKRITITGKVINNSKNIVFLAVGEKKAEKLFQIIKGKKADLPATHINAISGKLIWILDENAAKEFK